MDILEVKHLKKSYGTKTGRTEVLRDISLSVGENETLAVMGPSGSGKTTLLNLMSGIDRADGGEITIAGTRLSDMSRSERALFRRKKLGMVFQDFNLLDCLRVRENILLPMALEKKEAEEQEERLEWASRLLGIESILLKNVWSISGGEKQRAAIARAIVNSPALIFADEPTGNLDSKSSGDVMDCLAERNEKSGTAILMVTHDAYAASRLQRVVLLKDGRIVSELERKSGRGQFYREILGMLALIGGERDDL